MIESAWLLAGLVKAAELLGSGFALVVGWTDPEGSRPYLGALLLAYYDPDGRLVYVGRAGTGIKQAELERLWRRLQPLAMDRMPSRCRRRATAALARPWCSAAYIG
jgi:bifunctional non-homologous end joining protein LigD